MAVDAIGASRGLAIAWSTKAIELKDIHATHHMIQATFHIVGTNVYGHLTNVYFPQITSKKIAALNTMEEINSNRVHPLWIIGGDYNMITRTEEKKGGRSRLEQEVAHFKDFIYNNALIDM